MYTALTHNDLQALALRIDGHVLAEHETDTGRPYTTVAVMGRAWLRASDFAPHMLAVEAMGGTGDVDLNERGVFVELGKAEKCLQAWCSDFQGLAIQWRAMGHDDLAEWASDCFNDLNKTEMNHAA